MHWRSSFFAMVILALMVLVGLPSVAESQPAISAPVPGGLPIAWALTPFGDDPQLVAFARRHAPPRWANQRERGLNETQLRALSWLGPGPWFNPDTPSGVGGAAMVMDVGTGRVYLVYADGRTQVYQESRAWQPF